MFCRFICFPLSLIHICDGAFDGGFYAESYRRLSERSAAWADARYVRGNRRNVCWNSTADYLLLYPCITADSAGGKDVYKRQETRSD